MTDMLDAPLIDDPFADLVGVSFLDDPHDIDQDLLELAESGPIEVPPCWTSPTAKRILPVAASREQWHATRLTGMGGSEVAALLGLSPWESRFSLWHRKTGLASPQPENDEMEWGTLHEPTIAAKFASLHPELRMRRTGTWRNHERPWQIANPDRLLTGPNGREILEIKTARDADGWGTPGTDEIPVYYRAQVLWYLDCFGWSTARIVVLIAGSDYREYVVHYDPAEAAILREAAAEFWASVQNGVRPDLDHHDATYQVVRELHPDIDDISHELPRELADQYRQALADHKATEAAKQLASAAVLDEMGTARRAVCAGEQLAIRIPGRGTNPPYLKATPPKKTAGQKVTAA